MARHFVEGFENWSISIRTLSWLIFVLKVAFIKHISDLISKYEDYFPLKMQMLFWIQIRRRRNLFWLQNPMLQKKFSISGWKNNNGRYRNDTFTFEKLLLPSLIIFLSVYI